MTLEQAKAREHAVVSVGEGGAFVAAWLWVADVPGFPADDMQNEIGNGLTLAQLEWAKAHDWYVGWAQNADGLIGVYVNNRGGLPFMRFSELRAWAGY